jgi:hypothetical protein
VLPVQLLMSCSACPLLHIQFRLSFSACPVLTILFCLSCSASPVMPGLLCLSCPGFPVLVYSRQLKFYARQKNCARYFRRIFETLPNALESYIIFVKWKSKKVWFRICNKRINFFLFLIWFSSIPKNVLFFHWSPVAGANNFLSFFIKLS